MKPSNQIPPKLRSIFKTPPVDGKYLIMTHHNKEEAEKIREFVKFCGYPCEIRQDQGHGYWIITATL